MAGLYEQRLGYLCRCREWRDPKYTFDISAKGYFGIVLVDDQEYHADLWHESEDTAKESSAMVAFTALRSGHHRQSDDYPTSDYIGKQEKVSAHQKLRSAIDRRDFNATRCILHEFYDEVAHEDFAAIDEMSQLGMSLDDIAQELIEESRDSPWIFFPFEIPSTLLCSGDFHVEECLCQDNNTKRKDPYETKEMEWSDMHTRADYVKRTIDLSCGIGGVRPSAVQPSEMKHGRAFDFGFVKFDSSSCGAIVVYKFTPPGIPMARKVLLSAFLPLTATFATPFFGPIALASAIAVTSFVNARDTREETAANPLPSILGNILVAAGKLQRAGGCCNRFTYLTIRDTAVELHSISLQIICDLKEHKAALPLGDINELLPGFSFGTGVNDKAPHVELLWSIVVQFLSTAFLSYSQAHCGPLRSAFLDRGLEHIMLLGAAHWTHEYDGPCIVGSLVDLSCFGDMLGQPVLAFRYHSESSQAEKFVTAGKKYNLIASPHDVIDTWGPGHVISNPEDCEFLHAVYVGGGCITATRQSGSQTILHWSRQPRLAQVPRLSFDRYRKYIIGAGVNENTDCLGNAMDPSHGIAAFLHHLGTYPDHWDCAERQLGFGLQAGQSVIGALQMNQTWVKMRGLTLKSRMLTQLYKSDFEGLYGVEVSLCTGVARRVRLREMLSDLMPTYVNSLVSEPPLWKSLREDYNIIAALRNGGLCQWTTSLPHDHQRTFETLVIAILTLMRDTGIDNGEENLVIGYVQPQMPFQCLKIPCARENYWARMLADSDEIATFAYASTKCLVTTDSGCNGPTSLWANSAGLFWTEVSCCGQEMVPRVGTPTGNRWRLRHSEAYIIGAVDTPLFVKVDRPTSTDEPRLLVSMSRIPLETLRRLFVKARIGHKRRLREKRTFDPEPQEVFVLVSQGD